jgi:hypothetical protein
MKRKYLSWVVVLSIAMVAVMAVQLYAIRCSFWWNRCQGLCQGNPTLVVYSDQTTAVECDGSQAPCALFYWIQDCESEN